MADQADFPDIYIDSSVEAGGVGSEADPYSAFSEINWTTDGDNSITDYYAGSPAASVTINLQKGETWYETFTFGVGGTASYPVVLQAYGSGDAPIVDGKTILTTATYKWTASGSGTNEYRVELAAGGDPSLATSTLLFLNGSSAVRGGSAPDFDGLGSLSNLEWGYGNNDSLGYNTFYFRDDSGDPDTSEVVIDVPQKNCIRIYQKPYTLVDGIHIIKGDSESWGYRCDGHPVGHHNVIQNCVVEWCSGSGIASKTSYSTVDSCTVSYCGSHNIEAAGVAYTNRISNVTFSNNVSHHARTTGYSGSSPFDGYGLKFMWLTNSIVSNNHSYSNEFDGLDLDGSATAGCDDCEIYENVIHDNAYCGILVEVTSSRNKIYRNRVYDNGSSGGFDIEFFGAANDCEVFNNVVFKTKDNGRDNVLIGSLYSNEGLKIYGNTLHGGSQSNNCFYAENGTVGKNLKIFNNIMVATASGGQKPLKVDTCTDFTGFDADYNVYFADGGVGSDIIRYDGTNYTLTEWRVLGFGSHSIDADAVLTDAGSADYTLAAGSTCIDTGVNLGSAYDDALDPTSSWPDAVVVALQGDYGSGWDIGAYVDTASSINLSIADAALALASENLALTQAQVIAIQNAALALSSDNIDIIEGSTISGNNICRLLHLIMRG